jgi:hypothetical protein
MTTSLIVLAAVAVAVLLIGGIGGIVLLLSDRNRSADPQSQGDLVHGNYDSFAGGDCGGGGD